MSRGSGAPEVPSYPVPAGIARSMSVGIIYGETWSSRLGVGQQAKNLPPAKSHVSKLKKSLRYGSQNVTVRQELGLRHIKGVRAGLSMKILKWPSIRLKERS